MVMIMVIDYPGSTTMQTIQASEFKARCLALMDQVAASGEILVVTKNGKPVAELHPYQGARASSPFGLHPGVRILGDIVSPVADEDWEALS
ncbi:MAG: type II toxin-antitoxin system Phd/YefM family antitoxin [Thauera aminoaromatica]|jgi:prevent-host-death family protein|uniref:Antitoxin n=3 Tax=Thauera aminoaromatica TaxID=164330 RepID=A0A5C7T9Q0_THASP|nr:MAG: type II toxin-antitoxin system Phd/YefM family antitoxin [Thauera aminoaromatica]